MTEARSKIDALRESDGSLSHDAVKRILPYGDDFLFVRTVSHLTEREIVADFEIPQEANYLRSHFVDLPIMPGVLIGEGLAQAGSIIVRYGLAEADRKHVLGLEIERARFRSPALPGDSLTYRVRMTTSNRRAARLEGEVDAGDRRICEARLVVAIVDRRTLRDTSSKMRPAGAESEPG